MAYELKRRKYDGSDIRTILIGMITNDVVCRRIATRWSVDGMFESEWANLVGGWCVDHMRRFGSPPQSRITGRFHRWADGNQNKEVVEMIESFLQALSDQSDQEQSDADADYIIEVAARHFNLVRVKRAHKQAAVELEFNRLDEAYQQLANIRRVELGSGIIKRPADGYDQWAEAYSKERMRPMVTYPGEAGEFIGDAFLRGELYAFEGPDKTGKSSILRDLTYRGVRARNRVAFFDTGDSSYPEFLYELGKRASGTADKGKLAEYPSEFDKDDGKLITIERRLEEANPITGYRAFNRVCRTPDMLRVECHANGTLSVAGIDSILADWEMDGWRPDIVVIDYADILAPPEGIHDNLQQIDHTWRAMRRMSQVRNCLVVTATQSNAAAYGNGNKLLGRKHFSGRKTKLAEVNGMIGINDSD